MPSKAGRVRKFDGDLGVYGLPGDVSPWDIRFDPGDRAFLDREPDGRYRIRAWSETGLTDGLIVVKRNEEFLGFQLTVIASTGRFAFWEAALLFVLWFAQFLRAELRDEISWVYGIWGVMLLVDSLADRTRWRAQILFWRLIRGKRR